MASKKVVLSKRDREQLKMMLAPRVRAIAERVAAECNSESSWGFYRAYHDGPVSRVAVLSAAAGDGRSNRLVRVTARQRP